jgi:N-acetyl-anhydromuramyl-L-alanine amidase AmpD
MLTENDCYYAGKRKMTNAIVVHSTGANNPKLSRYVQPDDGILGDNKNNNDWNRGGVQKCVHAMIGKDKNGTVRVYQTLPWNNRCWGCGSGKKGSYNDNAIQFEICEDALTDEKYFNEAFTAAIELCAYLCKEFNIPVDKIVSHKEAHALGYASNHGDCDNWLKKFGKDMKWFRNQVKVVMNVSASTTTSGGKTVNIELNVLKKGAKGEQVKTLQRLLIAMGYNCGNAGVDGDFGSSTDSAVRKYQKANKLTVDGCVGKGTWTSLLK